MGPFPIPVCSGQLSSFNEAESRKDWKLDRPWLRACLRLAEQLAHSLFSHGTSVLTNAYLLVCPQAKSFFPDPLGNLRNAAVSRHSNANLHCPAETEHPPASPGPPRGLDPLPHRHSGEGRVESNQRCQNWTIHYEDRPLLLS